MECWCWSLVVCVVGMLCIVMILMMKAMELLWWRPRRLEDYFAKQGIKGPPYRFFMGCVKEMMSLMLEASSKPMIPQNSHNILPRVLSFYHQWSRIFVIWFGPTPRIAVAEPELIHEILVSRSELFERYESHPLVRQLEGEGLVSLRGEKWAQHRRVLAPTFHTNNLKLLIPLIGKTVLNMVENLASRGENGKEIEVDVSEWFQTVTEDAITRVAFGRSYDGGKAVFQLQTQQMAFAAEAFRKVFIPGYRFIPTKKNTSSWRVEKEIKRRLSTVIRQRQKPMVDGKAAKDLLGLMMKAKDTMSVRDIMEECKTFFFAGKQTTSNLLTWTTVLLAMHQDWQHQARKEVLQICGSQNVPTCHHLPDLKTVGYIINETLRLYPPAVATIRRAKRDVELGGYNIPRRTELLIPIMAIHHDAKLWGPDVSQFNPGRFAEPQRRQSTTFLPFGIGRRMCIGQNLALMEAKLTIAVLLQRFSFRLSPAYVHAPTVLMLMYPQYGAPIIFTPLIHTSSSLLAN